MVVESKVVATEVGGKVVTAAVVTSVVVEGKVVATEVEGNVVATEVGGKVVTAAVETPVVVEVKAKEGKWRSMAAWHAVATLWVNRTISSLLPVQATMRVASASKDWLKSRSSSTCSIVGRYFAGSNSAGQ